jgi:hypothetical protein
VISALSRPASVSLIEPEATSLKWLYVAGAFHIACAAVLAPVTSHPYDLAGVTGPAQAWLTWGVSPFYNWKFGLDFTALAVAAQALAAFLSRLGLTGIVALHIAWKLPLVAADLATAAFIYRLGLRFAPRRASLLAALWLVNPAVLWVSAGHGQVESIAILCLFGALELALSDRLIVAGVVTGLGVGVEYFPIAVLAAIAVLWRGGWLTGRRPVLRYGAGLAVSLLVCFVPSLVDPIGRPGLVGGLVSSAGFSTRIPGYTAQPMQSLITAWAWIDYRGSGAWPIVFGISAAACVVLAWRFARRGPWVAIAMLSALLLLAVLLDANALPQFASVAAASLWLLALVVEVQPLALVGISVAGIVGYFLFLDSGQSNANAFFFDSWANRGALLWPVPTSGQAAIVTGHLFSLGWIVAAAYAVLRMAKPSWVGWSGAATAGAGVCIALVIWASQPSIWVAAFGNPLDANLPDFDSYVASRDGTMVALKSDSYQVSLSGILVAAARASSVHPQSGLRLTVDNLVQQTGVGDIQEPQSWPNHSVVIPDWQLIRPSIQSLWVEVYVGSPDWSASSPPRPSDVALLVTGARVPAERVVLTNQQGGVGWALVDFQLPSAQVPANGGLDVTPIGSRLLWNGSSAGPWVKVFAASGHLQAVVDLAPIEAPFEVDTQNQGFLSGLPLESSYTVQLAPAVSPPFQVEGAVVRWPPGYEAWKRNAWFQTLGACFAVALLLATAWLVAWCVKPSTLPGQSRHPGPPNR